MKDEEGMIFKDRLVRASPSYLISPLGTLLGWEVKVQPSSSFLYFFLVILASHIVLLAPRRREATATAHVAHNSKKKKRRVICVHGE